MSPVVFCPMWLHLHYGGLSKKFCILYFRVFEEKKSDNTTMKIEKEKQNLRLLDFFLLCPTFANLISWQPLCKYAEEYLWGGGELGWGKVSGGGRGGRKRGWQECKGERIKFCLEAWVEIGRWAERFSDRISRGGWGLGREKSVREVEWGRECEKMVAGGEVGQELM